MTFRLFAPFVLAAAACSTATTPPGPPTVDAAPPTSNSTAAPAPAPPTTPTTTTRPAPAVDTLDANRARLLATYTDVLKTSTCTTWNGLAPSAQLVFLTLTARLHASKLGTDSSSMLSHITKIYRIAGGENATATDPGSCGGGEFNRMIMSMDAALHGELVTANAQEGNIRDAAAGSFWRDSHDLGGPHAPFDLSDETDNGAPRGQTQFFADPTSTLANSPLGRQDLASLVDPLAIEMDQDYDCAHNSNPACSYTFYGPLCAPETSKSAVEIYTENYGSPETDWKPSCN